MNIKVLNKILLSLFLLVPWAHAEDQTDTIVYPKDTETKSLDYETKLTIDRLNDNFRRTSRRLRELESGISVSSLIGIIQPDQGGTGQDSSGWTAGDFVYLSSTGIWGHKSLGGLQVITTPGSGTFTASTNIIFISCLGSGGGGERGVNATPSGGGGGAGAYLRLTPYFVTPGNTYNYTVGVAGIGSASGSSTATNGGDITFDGNIVCSGGFKGVNGTGGLGGTASTTPSLNATGAVPVSQSATPGTLTLGTSGSSTIAGGNAGNAAGNTSGAGGSSFFGTGGSGYDDASPGNHCHAGTGYGSGGGGGSADNHNQTGCDGTSGFLIFAY